MDAGVAAEAEDFEAALQLLGELEPKLTEFEILIEQRDRYNEQSADLQSRMPTRPESGSQQTDRWRRNLANSKLEWKRPPRRGTMKRRWAC